MKTFLPVLLLCVFLAGPVFADFESRVTIQQKPEILKLSDENLTNAYENVLVEIEATKTFHTTSGFTPKQYDEYRDLLKYRLDLLMEIHNRNLELPPQLAN